jgi:hypothetical protein
MFNSKFSKFAMITFLIGLSVLVLLGVSCSGKTSSSLVGKWNLAPEDRPLISLMNQIEFLSDGTYKTDFSDYIGKYSFRDTKHVILTSPNGNGTFYFSISGDTLTIEDEQGNVTHFLRSHY